MSAASSEAEPTGIRTSPQFDSVARLVTARLVASSPVYACVHKTRVYMHSQKPPQVDFSDTSSLKFLKTKGSIGHAFTVCIHTENQNQRSFYPFVLHEISVLIELLLGHLCYRLTDVPPQPNSPPDLVSRVEDPDKQGASPETDDRKATSRTNEISKLTSGVVVFHRRFASPTYATPPKSIHKV